MSLSFNKRVKDLIKRIPKGKVAPYGLIATFAGNHRAAREVAWLLHSSSSKDRLPWHRVVSSKGVISLRRGSGYEVQRALLKKEDVEFDSKDRIDLDKYLWVPSTVEDPSLPTPRHTSIGSRSIGAYGHKDPHDSLFHPLFKERVHQRHPPQD